MVRALVFLGLAAVMTNVSCTRTREVEIDISMRHQTIEGWGTSMIFWSLSEAPYEDAVWREAYRDLGLNVLRINVNKEVLVDASGDLSVPVRLEGDLDDNIAKMDFTNPKTRVFADMAVWLQKNALEPDRVRITGSVWSPPHWMKGPTGTQQHHVTNIGEKRPTPWLSGETRGDSIGGRLLQTNDNLEQFGRYLTAWVEGFERHYGVPIHALSIQNELSFENPFDSATYEKGSDGRGQQWWQYAAALGAVRRHFVRHRLSTRIMGPHMSQVGVTPSDPWGLWHQMSYLEAVRERGLMDALSYYNCNGYLDGTEDAVKMWAAYYQGKASVPGDWAAYVRAPGISQDGKPVWVSEAGGAKEAWLDGESDSAGGGAITVAQKIHNALVYANASAYVHWQMSDTSEREHEHVLLGKANVRKPTKSKKYSAFKHFSRYIRPGAVRVDASFANRQSSIGGKSKWDTQHALNVSAYIHDADGTVTVVFVNMRPEEERVRILLTGHVSVAAMERHQTSARASFEKLGDVPTSGRTFKLTVPAHSVVTLHGSTGARSEAPGR